MLDAKKRIKSLRPFGVIIATSVLISFHPHYVTAGDRIYFLQCFHTRASDHSLLPGSVVPATSASKKYNNSYALVTLSFLFLDAFYGSVSMPRCDYQIRNLKDNELTDSTAIGEMVQHRWSCSTGSNEELCLIVTNCFMITSDSRHQLVDKNGCSLDRSVLPNLVYIDNLNVEQNVSVFGLSQKPFVYFQCQISLLQPNFGRCLQPNCSNNHRTRYVC
ncbi:unnamed protein product [Thelazia callipaeda]|uniref:ZP domain-containing protein n=1 Tax=Thelazia callipaeda TaxID=103827 RepID=A0A0N5D7P2_THECL|nr:unnamed protein product [Thelazia callipaeda]